MKRRFILVIIALFVSNCESRKDPEFARMEHEVKAIQTTLKIGGIRKSEEDLKSVISKVSPDGLSRWEIAQENGYLIRSSKKYLDLQSKGKKYYYIDNNYDILRLPSLK